MRNLLQSGPVRSDLVRSAQRVRIHRPAPRAPRVDKLCSLLAGPVQCVVGRPHLRLRSRSSVGDIDLVVPFPLAPEKHSQPRQVRVDVVRIYPVTLERESHAFLRRRRNNEATNKGGGICGLDMLNVLLMVPNDLGAVPVSAEKAT
jgi:hypothetical protein